MIVYDLESRFRQRLEAHAEAIRKEFPDVEANIWSGAVGSRTDYQGHDIGIDCGIGGVSNNQPNNVALIIGVMHLTTEPVICEAEVVWGHPSGRVEIDLLGDTDVPYADMQIAVVEDRLDELVAALRGALRRGKPADESN